MRRVRMVAAALAGALLAVPVSAPADTLCPLGGPAPGFRAMRLDLPNGSDYAVLRITGTRAQGALNDSNGWHLAQGIMLLNASTLELVAYHVKYQGDVPATIAVENDGETIVRSGALAPEGQFVHGASADKQHLDPGSYFVVAFGTGGANSGSLSQWFQTSIDVDGVHTCSQTVAGETFDIDQTQMTGGTQAYVPGAGTAAAVSKTLTTARSLVVGLIDSAVQGAGSIQTCAAIPGIPTKKCVGREIVPFVGGAGSYTFDATYTGTFPLAAMTGVALDPSTLADGGGS